MHKTCSREKSNKKERKYEKEIDAETIKSKYM